MARRHTRLSLDQRASEAAGDTTRQRIFHGRRSFGRLPRPCPPARLRLSLVLHFVFLLHCLLFPSLSAPLFTLPFLPCSSPNPSILRKERKRSNFQPQQQPRVEASLPRTEASGAPAGRSRWRRCQNLTAGRVSPSLLPQSLSLPSGKRPRALHHRGVYRLNVNRGREEGGGWRGKERRTRGSDCPDRQQRSGSAFDGCIRQRWQVIKEQQITATYGGYTSDNT